MVAAPRNNTSQAIRAAVRDYFTLLQAELRGRRWWLNKGTGAFRDHFVGDGEGRAHLWHGQISAVLIANGLPYLSRVPPLPNTDVALHESVEKYLSNHPDLLELMEKDVFRRIDSTPPVTDWESTVESPPSRDEIPGQRDMARKSRLLAGVDFLAREQRNHSLAIAGQQFVMNFEKERLRAQGRDTYADGIEFITADNGDGPGYAIHSYGLDGSNRLIEVKTTCYGRQTPFYVSAHEVAMSRRHGGRFWIYRVFDFRQQPRLYMLNGTLEQNAALEPIEYRATPRQRGSARKSR